MYWLKDWFELKNKILKSLDSKFPNPNEFVTITTLNQLPNVDRRTTFSFESVEQARDAFSGKIKKYIYLRLSNPTIEQLENMVTLLEAKHFVGDISVPNLSSRLSEASVKTLAFSCGMAAISHTLISLLRPNDTLIVDKILYGCTDNFVNIELKENRKINVVEVETPNIESVKKAFKENKNVKAIYFESPNNPMLGVSDIKTISEIANSHGALVIVDNTFATPCLQNPLRLGADIVVHSLTKYINGHGDVLGGSVTAPKAFIDDEYGLSFTRRLYGGVMDPGQALSILRGIVTLPLRIEKHCDNAEKVVEFLKGHRAIKKVYYPGLEEKSIAEKQMRRFGGMVAFELNCQFEKAERVINEVVNQEVGYIAVSLGLPYTLFDYPAGMTHFFVPPQKRKEKGITDTLVRISVGLEESSKILSTLDMILKYA